MKNTEKERLAIALSYGKPLYKCQNDCTYEGAGSLQAIGDTGPMPLNKSFPPVGNITDPHITFLG